MSNQVQLNRHSTWATIISFGDYPGPEGPWPSEEAAMADYDAWYRDEGWMRDVAAYTPRLAGPFASCEEALEADISTCTRIVRPLY